MDSDKEKTIKYLKKIEQVEAFLIKCDICKLSKNTREFNGYFTCSKCEMEKKLIKMPFIYGPTYRIVMGGI